jgi:hypothetical protein
VGIETRDSVERAGWMGVAATAGRCASGGDGECVTWESVCAKSTAWVEAEEENKEEEEEEEAVEAAVMEAAATEASSGCKWMVKRKATDLR